MKHIKEEQNITVIGKNIKIGDKVIFGENIKIIAEEIIIRNNVSFGSNIDIHIKGKFSIDEYSRLGDNTYIRGNNASFGKHLFNSAGLRIGGGGRQHPNANFSIGDRCTIHNNFINVCEPVIIGNDVGLSPEVTILTHGYWLSALNGFPAKFAGVKIDDGVIAGYRSLILMGVHIGKNAVIAAQSVVTKDLAGDAIYAGNPAKKIIDVIEPSIKEKIKLLNKIIVEYKKIAKYHNINPKIRVNYPFVHVNDCIFNVESFEFEGNEDKETDDFRDYVRKWGLRFFSKRPFKSHFTFYNDIIK